MNRSMEKRLLSVAQFAPVEKKLEISALVLDRMEAHPEQQVNSRPNRSAVRKLLKRRESEEVKSLWGRLKALSAVPRRRRIMPPPPVVDVTVDIQVDVTADVKKEIVEEVIAPVAPPVAPIIETGEPAPIPPPTPAEALAKTEIGGRIGWTCMDCRRESLCCEVNGRWICRGCESEKKMFEPPDSVSILHHHTTLSLPPAAPPNFARQSEAVQRRRQAAEARAADHRAREEKEQRQRDIANISRLSFADQARILMP